MKQALLSLGLAGLSPSLALAAEGGGNEVLKFRPDVVIWTALTFLVLIALLGKLAFKPIAEALDRRSQTIRASLDDAERSRAEAKKLLDDYQRQLAEARAAANQVMEEAREIGEKVRLEIVEKAGAESAAVLQRAREEIQRQKEKGLQELKDTVARLSVQIAGRVMEKEIDASAHRILVENLIQDLTKIPKN